MANLKNITDLPVVESAEGVNLIVNDNGAAKQIPASIVGGSGGADWNAKEGEPGYVKNRTHYEEMVVVNEPLNITWDGNTEGLVCVNVVEFAFYKISEVTPTVEQLNSGAFVATHYEDEVYNVTDLSNISDNEDIAAFLQKDNIGLAVAYTDNANIFGFSFPEKGLYFTVVDGFLDGEPGYIQSFTTTEPIEHIEIVVHKLDKQYLPDEVFNGSKLIINASTTDYNTYTIDRSYAEIKEYADNDCDVAVQFMWTPNPGGADNDPALYTAPLVHIQSDGSMYFTVDSYYPEFGKATFRIRENEVEFSVASYLPFSKKKGSYLVGKNSFDWEISPYPIVYSPNGTKYKISVDNNGTLSATEVT